MHIRDYLQRISLLHDKLCSHETKAKVQIQKNSENLQRKRSLEKVENFCEDFYRKNFIVLFQAFQSMSCDSYIAIVLVASSQFYHLQYYTK